MSELRQDRTTGMWVIVAPERQRRPWDWGTGQERATMSEADGPNCPFCPGHESRLSAVVAEIKQEKPPGWLSRAVRNRYPALQMAKGESAATPSNHHRWGGWGRHEVVIESPRHDADLDSLSEPEVEAALRMYQQRYLAIADMPGIEWVVVFRNHGERAGSSLRHPHAQLIGLPLTSYLYGLGEKWAGTAYEQTGRCVLCQEIENERRSGVRVVEENDQFIALVPFAPVGPFELWIVPKRHVASFGAATTDTLRFLAQPMRGVLRRLKRIVGDLPYNIVIDSACRSSLDLPYLHWKVRIVPALTTPGGFELGTAIRINPSLPEADADALRGAVR